MPSKSYLSLLVLALAASTASPVRCSEILQIEDREDSSRVPASESRHHTRGVPGLAKVGIGLTSLLLTVALVTTLYPGGGKNNNPPQNRPNQSTGAPSTDNTQPTPSPQPNNPPRTFIGREERDLGRRLPVDTSTGSSEASSTNNKDGRISDLLSRADLSKELTLFSRILDKLD